MLFMFRCSQCDREIEADSSVSGQHVACPRCGVQEAVPFAKVGPGTTVGGFRLESLLGRGGMGEVYLATQVSMNRHVAVKILPDLLIVDKSAIDRFLREARLAARLDHPNAATIFAAGEDDGTYYLAMEYIDGESLDIRLKRTGALGEAEALDIVRKTALALAYAWGTHQMLHRDLKPANIMVTGAGAVKLVDLGLAKGLLEESTVTMTGATLGTPPYMSPEQINDSKDVDPRSDIYSLGTTLYHFLTGACPFVGSSMAQVFHKVLNEPPRPIGELHPDVSSRCVALVESMMAKDRNDRPQDWAEVIRRIEEIQTAPSLSASSAGVAEPEDGPPPQPPLAGRCSAWLGALREWVLLRRTAIGIGLAVVVLAVLLLMLALRKQDEPGESIAPPASTRPGDSSASSSEMAVVPGTGESGTELAPGMEPLPRAPENFVYGYFFFYPQTTTDPSYYVGQMADFSNTAVFYAEYENTPTMLAALRRNDLRVIAGTTLRRGDIRGFAESSNGIPKLEYAQPHNILVPGLLDRYIRTRKRLNPDCPVVLITELPASFPEVEPLPFPIPELVDIVVCSGISQVWDASGTLTPEELRLGTAAWMRQACRDAGGRPVIASGAAMDKRLDSALVRNTRPFVAGVVEGGGAGVLWWNICVPEGKGYGAMEIPGLLETHRQIARELGVGKLPPDFFKRFLRPVPKPEARPPHVAVPEANEFGLWLDGKDDNVVIPSFIYDGSHPITLEAVVRPDLSGATGFTLVISSAQAGGLWIARTGQMWSGAAHDGSSYREIRSGVPPVEQQTHVALVLADKTLRFSVDGILQAKPIQMRDFFPSSEPLMIGADPSNFMVPKGKFFRGSIEEVRISKVARYGAEAFTPRIPMPVDRDTVVLLRFEEGEGEVAHDASGNGNDGFIRGARWHRVGQPPAD